MIGKYLELLDALTPDETRILLVLLLAGIAFILGTSALVPVKNAHDRQEWNRAQTLLAKERAERLKRR